MDEIMEREKAVLNTILNFHHTDIGQQVGATSLQVRLRNYRFQMLQIRPVTYDKHLAGMTAAAFDGKSFL